jgi:hypothetical protein
MVGDGLAGGSTQAALVACGPSVDLNVRARATARDDRVGVCNEHVQCTDYVRTSIHHAHTISIALVSYGNLLRGGVQSSVVSPYSQPKGNPGYVRKSQLSSSSKQHRLHSSHTGRRVKRTCGAYT